MKIGVYDSGIGGLVTLKAYKDLLPNYDFVYFGDTQHAPYGDKSHEELFDRAQVVCRYLFEEEKCQIVITACNSLAAVSLRRLQQEWLPHAFPDRKILGVLVPVAEYVVEHKYDSVGILATRATVESRNYIKEIHKINPSARVVQVAAPRLVPLIEAGMIDVQELEYVLEEYLQEVEGVEVIVPGCTHYPLIREVIERISGIKVLDTPEIQAESLKEYLRNHHEVADTLSRGSTTRYLVTKDQESYHDLSLRILGEVVQFTLVSV
jgi:glutamate racemase